MATSTKKTTAPAAAAILDFSNVSEGGQSFNKKRVPAGDYLARITAVVSSPSSKDGGAQWLFTIQLENKFTDRKFPFYCKLVENQLWKLRNLLLAAGMAVPKKKVKLDPNRVVGKLIGVTLDDDEYDGKAQSNVSATFPASELTDTESDTEEEYDTEEEDEETEDEEDEATEDSDDTEDEEDEEEPAPAPKKAAARGSIPRQTKREVAEVSDDELDELDLDEL